MAVKTSSLTFGTGPQVWFYTPADPASAPGSQNFPGIQNPGNCGAEVGDVLIIKSVKALAPGGAFVPDSNGYMPHLAIYPAADVDVMTLVAQRFPLEWDAHAEAFNVVSATLAQAQGRDSAHVLPSAERVRLLLPAARESAREARALEVEEARRLVAKHKVKHTTKGRSGAAAAKRNGARTNGAAKRGARKARA